MKRNFQNYDGMLGLIKITSHLYFDVRRFQIEIRVKIILLFLTLLLILNECEIYCLLFL